MSRKYPNGTIPCSHIECHLSEPGHICPVDRSRCNRNRRGAIAGPDRWGAIAGCRPPISGTRLTPEREGDVTMSEIRTIATGLRFPEGPVAMKDGSVVLVEIERQTVTRVRPDGSTEVVAHTGGGPNGLAVGPDGAFYVCNNGGFQWRTEENLLRPAMASSDYVSGSIQRVD